MKTSAAKPLRGPAGLFEVGNAILLICFLVLAPTWLADARQRSASEPAYLSPTALVVSADGETLFIACATGSRVLFFDTILGKIKCSVPVPDSPLGLALSTDGKKLFVTCAAPESTICIIDVEKQKIIQKIPAGHTAMAPVASPNGKTLFVCNRFDNSVSAFDLAKRKKIFELKVPREPVAAAVTPDSRHLFVANHIQAGRSDGDYVAASVTVIDTETGKSIRDIPFPNGSTLLRGVAISPDGKYAAVTHSLGRYHLPTTQIERGWINNNALSLIDIAKCELINTVLLDNIDRGAANPWGVTWNDKSICVTHAGTHEVTIIDPATLLAKLIAVGSNSDPVRSDGYSTSVSRTAADVPNDLAFLIGIKRRIPLGEEKGPRDAVVAGNKLYTVNFFSDSLSVIDLEAKEPVVRSISLNPSSPPLDIVRQGELNFNDGSVCFQGWQSCASCHSSDARVDGLNWDNLNDGIGNPKNAKSLLLAHFTPPSMALGVRANAHVAVRAGIKNSLFVSMPEDFAAALDEYLKSLKPAPSPYLTDGKLSKAGLRGKKLFLSEEVGCADCHKGPLLTDMKVHDVGTVGAHDNPTNRFDTPTLIEAWRSAPYLHDGSAATVKDVLTIRNLKDKHGNVSHLTEQQIDDLETFVLSQ
jgi:DNA-binding beta-propeller fold protein YncE